MRGGHRGERFRRADGGGVDAGADLGGAGHQRRDLRPGQPGAAEEPVVRAVRGADVEDRAAGVRAAGGGAAGGGGRVSGDFVGHLGR